MLSFAVQPCGFMSGKAADTANGFAIKSAAIPAAHDEAIAPIIAGHPWRY